MGETNLNKILGNLNPKIAAGEFFFASFDESQLMLLASYLSHIIAIFKEEEGLTVVFSDEIKDDVSGLAKNDVIGPFAFISLGVNSDLMSVGLLAKITAAFEKEKISINVFSGYNHDHLFVPSLRKDDAIRILSQLKPPR